MPNAAVFLLKNPGKGFINFIVLMRRQVALVKSQAFARAKSFNWHAAKLPPVIIIYLLMEWLYKEARITI